MLPDGTFSTLGGGGPISASYSRLVQAGAGNLYGTAYLAAGSGLPIFRLTLAGQLSIVSQCPGSCSELTLGVDGAL